MSQKRAKVASLIEGIPPGDLDPHYLAYFRCFNQQLYFEAHEVLEVLWLTQRRHLNGAFYKGLIQLAGAFVHLQKGRLGPAARLFELASTNLERYPASHESLDVSRLRALVQDWLSRLASSRFAVNPLVERGAPLLELPVP